MSGTNALTLNEPHDWTSEYQSDDPVRGKAIRFVTDHYVVGREKSALPSDRQYIVIELREGWRRLEAGSKPEWLMREPGQPKPEQPHVPESEFVRDLSGQLVNPWRYLKWLYLVDASTGVISTLGVGSVGGLMSVAELGQQISGMRQLKGSGAVPVIELSIQAFKTKFGLKKRPEFVVVGWKATDHKSAPLLTNLSDDTDDASAPF
jgi:hypothetical protein